MTFNIVNEKFATTSSNPLSNEVNRFLQEVWNEAIVTVKKMSRASIELHGLIFMAIFTMQSLLLQKQRAQKRFMIRGLDWGL